MLFLINKLDYEKISNCWTYVACGPVPESKATMSAPDGIIPFDNAVQVQESSVH